MIMLRIFRYSDLDKLSNPIEPFVPLQAHEDFAEDVRRGISVTGEQAGRVVACGGIIYENEREGTAWLRVSKDKRNYHGEFAREVIELFGKMRECAGALLVSCYVLSGFKNGEKMARLAGFSPTSETISGDDRTYTKYTVN